MIERAISKNLQLDRVEWKNLNKFVIGVDEVGRGCLAGPVYAAACLLNPDQEILSLNDSKKLTPKKRVELSREILKFHDAHVSDVSVEIIDEINILQASLFAMKKSVEALLSKLEVKYGAQIKSHEVTIVVDGHMKIPDLDSYQQITLIQGDARCAPVSAASIIAKVARDQFMTEIEKQYPGYHFGVHKGYGTQKHRDAIAQQGPCPLHRKTFAGVKEYLS